MDELFKIFKGNEPTEDEVDPGFSNVLYTYIMKIVEYIMSFFLAYIPMPL